MVQESKIQEELGNKEQSLNVDEELAKQKVVLEARLLEKPLDTFKSFSDIASDLGFPDEEAFIAYLSNKKILDMGSGFNGLAIGCILKCVPTDITSVTPRMNDPNFKGYMRKLLFQEKAYERYSTKDKENAIRKSLQNTRADFAHDLSFGDESFDIVIDNAASFYYAKKSEPFLLRRNLQEELRVLRKGGLLRVGDFTNAYGSITPSWKERILIEEGVSYRPINEPHTSGVEIKKTI